MKILIVGAGNLGLQLARELVEEKRDVVIIEKNPDIARGIANELDCLVKEGDGENLDILEDAGAREVDWFIALTGSDEANIVACGLVAEAYSRPKTIARVRSHYFGSFHSKKKRILGVDYILNPDAETAEAVARLVFRGMSSETIDVKEAGIQLRILPCSDDSRFPGRPLIELRAHIGRNFIVPAVVHDDHLLIPSGDYIPEPNDIVYLLGEPHELDKLFGQSTKPSLKLKYLVFLGANALTRRVLKELGMSGPEDSSRSRKASTLSLIGNPVVKVIDSNRENAKLASQEFPDAEVVCRSLSDEFLIDEEGLGKADIVFGLTDSQGDNLVSALVAKQAGALKALSVIYNDFYMKLTGVIDIDAIVNQKSVAAGAILDIIRKAHIRRLHSFAEGEFELVEMTIGQDFPRPGIRIKDLGLPKGILIAFVIHDGETIIPVGDTQIHPMDSVGLILAKQQIDKLESSFGA
jgi:trk system potassium uptake protein TrkA